MNVPQNERGSVLVLTLMIAMMLLVAGVAVMQMSSKTTKIAGNFNRRTEAFGAAETGLQRGISILKNSADWATLVSGSSCSPTVVDPDGVYSVLCDNSTPLENQTVIDPSSATYAYVSGTSANIRYTVWIRNDPAEYSWCNGAEDLGEEVDDGDCNHDGSNNALDEVMRRTDSDGRVMVKAVGTARDGTSLVTLGSVVSKGASQALRNQYSQSGLNAAGSSSTRNQ
jgi:Tfp pilus assembly protein PilX